MREAHNQILVRLVWWLPFLLPSTHEPSARQNAVLDLWQMDLHHHALLTSVPVADFGYTVSWPTDFQENLALHAARRRGNHELRVLGIPGSTTSEVGLMFLSLSMCQVGTFICVECQAQTTFKGSKMVAENVWILEDVLRR